MQRITPRYIDFDLAKVLHKLKYSGYYDHYWAYNKKKEASLIFKGGVVLEDECTIPAPTLNDVSDWLRERHQMVINVDREYDPRKGRDIWCFVIHILGEWNKDIGVSWQTYDEAFAASIKRALNLVKRKQQ